MRSANQVWLLRGAVLGLALAAGLVAWLVRGSGEGTPAPSAAPTAQIVTAAELANAAALSGHPVYWAGPVPGTRLELSEDEAGNVQVRYLPEGEGSGGGPAGRALTIGSYPLADPRAAVASLASEPGAKVRRSRRFGPVVATTEAPTSVYFAGSGNRVEVEVYDPSPRYAIGLALAGRVRPAGSDKQPAR